MKLQLDAHSLGNGPSGLEIGVKGFMGDPTAADEDPCQVYIEIYEGKLRVCVWDGSSQDPQTIVIDAATAAPAPATTPVCPKCGKTSITIRVDAFAQYALEGWDKDGEIVADFATPADVATFDDRAYVCDECSFESSDAADFQTD